MMTFALLAHWMACIWFVIGSVEQPGDYLESLLFLSSLLKMKSEIVYVNHFDFQITLQILMKCGLVRKSFYIFEMI